MLYKHLATVIVTNNKYIHRDNFVKESDLILICNKISEYFICIDEAICFEQKKKGVK